MIGVTTGATVERFSDDGGYGPIEKILMPVRRLALEYMGYDVARDYVAHGVPRSDDTDRKPYLAAFAKAAVAMAALPVDRTDDWCTALAAIPDAAWNRPI